MQSPPRLGIYALLLVMPLFFVSNLVIGRAVTSAVEPSTLAFWRWLLASLILLPFAWRGLAQHAPRIIALWRELLALGILGMLICGAGVYLSLRYTTASNAALIYTSSAILIVVLEAIFFRERLSPARIAGALIGFAGVAVIILHGELSRLISLQFNIGDLGMAFCAAAWAVYSVLLKKKELKALPP
jgi:drug/metabolite transporter (DMT)-like permease